MTELRKAIKSSIGSDVEGFLGALNDEYTFHLTMLFTRLSPIGLPSSVVVFDEEKISEALNLDWDINNLHFNIEISASGIGYWFFRDRDIGEHDGGAFSHPSEIPFNVLERIQNARN